MNIIPNIILVLIGLIFAVLGVGALPETVWWYWKERDFIPAIGIGLFALLIVVVAFSAVVAGLCLSPSMCVK